MLTEERRRIKAFAVLNGGEYDISGAVSIVTIPEKEVDLVVEKDSGYLVFSSYGSNYLKSPDDGSIPWGATVKEKHRMFRENQIIVEGKSRAHGEGEKMQILTPKSNANVIYGNNKPVDEDDIPEL